MYKILIVDDEKDVVRMLESFFRLKGYDTITAYNGEEALQKVSANPDLILLDINMPGNGLEILAKAKEDYPELPVLMLSAVADDKTVKKTKELGAAGFVAKPFQAEALLEHLRSV